MDPPGFRLHSLKGAFKGFPVVTVRANWRVIFRFDGGAEDVDYSSPLMAQRRGLRRYYEKRSLWHNLTGPNAPPLKAFRAR